MKVTRLKIPEIRLIQLEVFRDARGFFMETHHTRKYAEHGIGETFVQDNHSRSVQGTLRGLHYQLKQPQGKLVRVTRGETFDVAVDVRVGSPTFGDWVGVTLSEHNHRQLFIPPGFAHGFCALSEIVDFLYKCTDFHSPDDDYGVRWDDPDIGIEWPKLDYLLSDKDQRLPRLKDLSAELPVFQETR